MNRVIIFIIADINASDIEGTVPKEATLACLNPNRTVIQKFYRWHEIKFNDNTTKTILQYWGEQGGWHNSGYNVKPNGLKYLKFLKIIR